MVRRDERETPTGLRDVKKEIRHQKAQPLTDTENMERATQGRGKPPTRLGENGFLVGMGPL